MFFCLVLCSFLLSRDANLSHPPSCPKHPGISLIMVLPRACTRLQRAGPCRAKKQHNWGGGACSRACPPLLRAPTPPHQPTTLATNPLTHPPTHLHAALHALGNCSSLGGADPDHVCHRVHKNLAVADLACGQGG